MGKSTPSPPPAPDPYQTASAQGSANVATATAQTAMNNANVITPYGKSIFTQTGQGSITQPDGTVSTYPTYTNTVTLSDAQQKLLNQNNSLGIMANRIAGHALTSVGDTLSNPITVDQLSPLAMDAGSTPTLANGYSTGNVLASAYDTAGKATRDYDSGGPIASTYDNGGPVQRSVPTQQADTAFGGTAGGIQYNVDTQGITQARDAATNAALARLQPSMDQQNAQLQAQLANQGVSLGSSAYGSAMFNQAQANNDLRLGAVQVGDAEQQALYGQALQSGQFANDAQAQDFGQQQARGQFQQAGAAANNNAALAAGQFANAAQAQQNAQNAAAFQGYNAAQAQQNAQNATAMQLSNSAQAQQNAQNAASAQFYNSAQSQENQQNAALAAFGNTAMTQDYQNRLAGGTFQNQAVAQQLQQMMGLQNQQINEISALRSGGQVTGMQAPTYSAGTLDQTPISADVYQTAGLQNSQYMAQLQNSAANTAAFGSALSGLMGGIGRKSDRRLKTNIRPYARARNGLTIYAYHMPTEAPGWHLGFMADEVALLHPEAVWTDPADGFARVDYERAVA